MFRYLQYTGFVFSIFILVSCHSVKKEPQVLSVPSKKIGMPNPASVYCIQQHGRLEMKHNNLGEYADCILPNGQMIEEWTLYRRDHSVYH